MSAPLIVEKTVNAPVAKVWKAITDKNQMKQWYFDLSAFEAKKGFEFQFEGGEKDGPKYTHLCKVLEVIENKKLSHTWMYKDYEGSSTVTWELTDLGDKTLVKLTHTGLETFPKLPAFRKESFEAGWNSIVGKSLPKFVEK